MADEKVVRDGLVAVLVSPGFGAGWSTWVADEHPNAVFDPRVVEWVEAGKPYPHPYEDDENCDFYTGGLSQVRIEWVPVGTKFRIDEYDGSETLVVLTPDNYYTA